MEINKTTFFLIITAILFVSLFSYFIISYQYPIKNTCIPKKLKYDSIGTCPEACTQQKDYQNSQFCSSTGYSWCVSKDGIRIPWTLNGPNGQGSNNIDCKALINKLSFTQTMGLMLGRGFTRLFR